MEAGLGYKIDIFEGMSVDVLPRRHTWTLGKIGRDNLIEAAVILAAFTDCKQRPIQYWDITSRL
jgi:hypothetical protein